MRGLGVVGRDKIISPRVLKLSSLIPSPSPFVFPIMGGWILIVRSIDFVDDGEVPSPRFWGVRDPLLKGFSTSISSINVTFNIIMTTEKVYRRRDYINTQINDLEPDNLDLL